MSWSLVDVVRTQSATGTSPAPVYPTGIASGDAIYAALVRRAGTSTAVTAVESGFTLLRTTDITTSVGLSLYWKRAAGTETGATAWTLGASNDYIAAIIAFHSSTGTPSPFADVENATTFSASTSVAYPQLTTTVAGDLLLYIAGLRCNGGSGTVTPPASTAEILDANYNGIIQLTVDWEEVAATGLTTARTATNSTTVTDGAKQSIAVQPTVTAVALPDRIIPRGVTRGVTRGVS